MPYSRSNPSARYRELTALYRSLHREGEKRLGLTPEETYPGVSLLPHVKRIKELIKRTGAATLLDYGCGKGMQYEPHRLTVPGEGVFDGVIEYWDIDELRCYDPCYERYCTLPEGRFDGVISTDVLEHCTEDDIPWIVDEMFAYARRFVFACIACYAAKTTLPNGENAHTTVHPFAWWQEIFSTAAARHPDVIWKIFAEEHEHDGHNEHAKPVKDPAR
jgi:hypothetical protein